MSAIAPAPTAGWSAITVGELLLLGAIWGASFLFMRIAAPAFGALPLVELRLGFGALVLLPFLWMARHAFQPRLLAALALVGIVNSALPFALFAWAATFAPAGIGAICNALTVLFTAIAATAFFGERLGPSRWFALALGLLGVVVLASGRIEGVNVGAAVVAGTAAEEPVVAPGAQRELLDQRVGVAGQGIGHHQRAAVWHRRVSHATKRPDHLRRRAMVVAADVLAHSHGELHVGRTDSQRGDLPLASLAVGEFAGARGAPDHLRARRLGQRPQQRIVVVPGGGKHHDGVRRRTGKGLADALAEFTACLEAVGHLCDGDVSLGHEGTARKYNSGVSIARRAHHVGVGRQLSE